LQIEFADVLQGRGQELIRLRSEAIADVVCKILNETRALLVLDGFDEISDFSLRQAVLEQVRVLAFRLNSATLALTSRTGEFAAVIETARTFEICSLSFEQVKDFAGKWLQDKHKAETFLSQVYGSPFADSAIKPLTLAHLCAVFERGGAIPEKPKTVYRKILHLLVTDWDEQRSVKRVSRYSAFEADRKYDLLASLSFYLTVQCGTVVFSSRHIIGIYRNICQDFGLPESEAREVAREIEGHTGLFLQCGFSEFEFAHKSLQEFLSAEFLVRLPSIPDDENVLEKLPNELAIAVAISSNPSLYLVELVFRRFMEIEAPQQFFRTFVSRLLQERPDFNSQESVFLALLTLYSITLEGCAKDDPQLQLFLNDILCDEFEQLLGSILKTNSSLELMQYYSDAGPSRVASKVIVRLFIKQKDMQGINLRGQLHVRDTFLRQNPQLLGSLGI
jgi:hypothetical protein